MFCTNTLCNEYRCTIKDSDLEAPGATYRHREHSDILIEEFSIAQLWDEWGLVGEFTFYNPMHGANRIYYSHLQTTSREPISIR